MAPSKRRRPLVLVPPSEDDLPLAFQVGEHLSGEQASFVDEDTGKSLAGRRLDAQLSAFPIGLKSVQVSGYLVWENALQPWSNSLTVPGTLDHVGLGRICHQLAREIAKKAGPKDESPKEMYTTEIRIEVEDEGPRTSKRNDLLLDFGEDDDDA